MVWQMPEPSEAEKFFRNLEKKLENFKLRTNFKLGTFYSTVDEEIEFFDLKNGIFITREKISEREMVGPINDRYFYTIIKNSKLVNETKAKEILRELTGKIPPKELSSSYKATYKTSNKVITDKRRYPSLESAIQYQPDDEKIKKQLEKAKIYLKSAEENFGLKILAVEEMLKEANEIYSYFCEK